MRAHWTVIGSFENSLESENQPAANDGSSSTVGGEQSNAVITKLIPSIIGPRVTHIFGASAFGEVERQWRLQDRASSGKIHLYVYANESINPDILIILVSFLDILLNLVEMLRARNFILFKKLPSCILLFVRRVVKQK